MQVEKTTPSFPLSWSVSVNGVGVPGLTPTVAIRDAVSGDYFDFSDATFKASGWVAKLAPMVDAGNGNYQYMLAVASIASIQPGIILAAEYHVDNGLGVVADGTDTFEIVRIGLDASYARKMLTNRKKEVSGAPGTAKLTVYDDDKVTPLVMGNLTDESGGAVTSAVGSPAEFVPV